MCAEALGVIAPHPPIMVPEVGGARAAATDASAAAMREAAEAIRDARPETLVLMSPHAPPTADAFVVDASERTVGSLAAFGAADVALAYRGDPELAHAILEESARRAIPAIDRTEYAALAPGQLDHGALVPLSFIDRAGSYRLVELSLTFLPLADHAAFGEAVRAAATALGRRVVFVASGDCSHRLTPGAPAGYSPRAAAFDKRLLELISDGDYEGLSRLEPDLIESAGECGLRSFVTLGGFLRSADAETRLLAYEGPWGVGYLTALATARRDEETPESGLKRGMPGSAESEPVALARRTVETYVRTRRVIDPGTPTGVLATRHGAFVSLHRRGELRGCIGTIAPTAPTLAAEIVHNAIQAATVDPRFPPLGPDELDDLEISVDVLHTPEPTTMADLDPATFGVIVSCDWRRGLLLPDLDGVDTADQQVDIALRKAGIEPGAHVNLERFRVDRYT